MVVDATQAAPRRGRRQGGSNTAARGARRDASALRLTIVALAIGMMLGGASAWAQTGTPPVSGAAATATPSGQQTTKRTCLVPKELGRFEAPLPNLTRTVTGA